MRSWKASSLHNKLVTIQGALAILFIYRSTQISMVLARCQRWSACVTSVAHLMPLGQPNQPMPITEDQLMMAVSLEPRPIVKAALEMGWLAAARGADIRRVLAMEILFQPATKTIDAERATHTRSPRLHHAKVCLMDAWPMKDEVAVPTVWEWAK